MKPSSTPRVIAADRMHDGLLIFFADGSKAFYSGSLLYSVLENAEELNLQAPEINE
jgi:hypothetical protein